MLETRMLGRTGIEVTALGFGAWGVGGKSYGPVERKQAAECIETYLESGGNFIDTARAYDDSESILGEVMKSHDVRDRVVLATKTQMSRNLDTIPSMRVDLEESLRHLQTDYIDLFYMHAPPDDPDVMYRAFDEMERFKDEGKIRSIGASIKGPNVMAETQALCMQYIDSGRVDAIQLVYSILRQDNAKVFGHARRNGVAIIARTVIESGFLSGRYQPGHVFDSGHRMRWSGDNLAKILETVQEIEGLALKPPYQSLAQVAIRFALEPEGVSATIPGARTSGQVRANMEVDSLPSVDTDVMEMLRHDYADMKDVVNPAG